MNERVEELMFERMPSGTTVGLLDKQHLQSCDSQPRCADLMDGQLLSKQHIIDHERSRVFLDQFLPLP